MKTEAIKQQIKAFEKDLETLQNEINDPKNNKKSVSKDLFNQTKKVLERLNKELEEGIK